MTAGRTWHAFHVEGCGGGHWPDTLALAGRERILTSSTTPTVPFGVNAAAEHRAMVPAVHVLAPGVVHGDSTIVRHRVRAGTMAAEGVLHDLGVIAMLSSDSQGMGRVGEVVRRAFQNAAAMRALRGAEPGPGRQRAGAAPPREGHDQPRDRPRPRGATSARSSPASSPTSCSGSRTSSACGPSSCSRRASRSTAPPARATPARGWPSRCCCGVRSAARVLRPPCSRSPSWRARRSTRSCRRARERVAVEDCRDLTAASMVRHGRTGEVRVDPRTHAVTLDGEPRRRPAAGGGGALGALPARMSDARSRRAGRRARRRDDRARRSRCTTPSRGSPRRRRAARVGAGGRDLRAARRMPSRAIAPAGRRASWSRSRPTSPSACASSPATSPARTTPRSSRWRSPASTSSMPAAATPSGCRSWRPARRARACSRPRRRTAIPRCRWGRR